MSTTDIRNRRSAGHICFAGDFEFYDVEGEVYRANRSNAFDLNGYRHGRWECTRRHLDRSGFTTVTGLKPTAGWVEQELRKIAQEHDEAWKARRNEQNLARSQQMWQPKRRSS